MVGIFSRFSGSKSVGHRRSQSTLDQRDVLSPPPHEQVVNATATSAAAAASAPHGIDVAVEFKPVEHPSEPIDNDPPVKCPLPEPSILNDGRIWKERMSVSVQRTAELPGIKSRDSVEKEANGARLRSSKSNRSILPSVSAPEHNLIDMLEECNAAGI